MIPTEGLTPADELPHWPPREGKRPLVSRQAVLVLLLVILVVLVVLWQK